MARRCGAKHISSQNAKKPPLSEHFWKLGCRKWHAAVARSTFASQNAKKRPLSEHFWKLRCRKTARRCGAKHISSQNAKNVHCRSTFGSWDVEKWHAAVARSTFQVKMLKTSIVGALLEVGMSKNGTPLWREAHLQVKMLKNVHCRSTFGSCDVEKRHAAVARSTFASQNAKNTCVLHHF